MQELVIRVPMRANRRGIYRLEDLRLYSGDGLGLTQTGMTVEGSGRVFAVYPRIVPVRTDLFIRTEWTSAGKQKGYLEDPTLVRGSRDYSPADSWKQINWRMAARGLPLAVNLPEMITPGSLHFILDGESFSGQDADPEGLELSLSILGSVLIRLEHTGLHCGLTLPLAGRGPAVTYPSGTAAGELLFALAAYEPRPFVLPPGGKQPARPVSVFETSAALAACRGSGRIYYLTRRLADADNILVRRLRNQAITVLPLEEPGRKETAFFNGRVVPLRSILQ
jgi:uncharacterized protein (DUF58 family)